nr:MAG TPA: hypothetical protein [Caudoviricetes sp.]
MTWPPNGRGSARSDSASGRNILHACWKSTGRTYRAGGTYGR